VVVGSPEIIGHWRAEAPDKLKGLVREEYVKNLVGLPMTDLVVALRAARDAESP
jgi:hypothetical protein